MSEESRQKILQTAFTYFLENAYRGTTYSKLIAATGMSKGALYHYFKNKEELFFAVIDEYFLSFFRKINWDEVKNLNPEEFEQSVYHFFRTFISEIKQVTNKGLGRYTILFFEAMEIHPTFKTEVQNHYLKLKAISNQILKNNNIDLIAKYEGYFFWLSVFPDEKFENLIDF